jgi:hypothetical protein
LKGEGLQRLSWPGAATGVRASPQLREWQLLREVHYRRLGTVRHRAKVVEYRVEQQTKVLKEQLAALGLGVGKH